MQNKTVLKYLLENIKNFRIASINQGGDPFKHWALCYCSSHKPMPRAAQSLRTVRLAVPWILGVHASPVLTMNIHSCLGLHIRSCPWFSNQVCPSCQLCSKASVLGGSTKANSGAHASGQHCSGGTHKGGHGVASDSPVTWVKSLFGDKKAQIYQLRDSGSNFNPTIKFTAYP